MSFPAFHPYRSKACITCCVAGNSFSTTDVNAADYVHLAYAVGPLVKCSASHVEKFEFQNEKEEKIETKDGNLGVGRQET